MTLTCWSTSSPFIWAQATQGHCSTKSDRCPRVRKYLLLQSSELALGRVPAHRCRKCWYQNWGCSNIMYVVTTPLSHSLLLDLSALGPQNESRENISWAGTVLFLSCPPCLQLESEMANFVPDEKGRIIFSVAVISRVRAGTLSRGGPEPQVTGRQTNTR